MDSSSTEHDGDRSSIDDACGTRPASALRPCNDPAAARSASPRAPAALRAFLRPLARRYRRLPTSRKMRLRRWLYMPLEAAEALMGRRDPLLPPRALRYVGRGDFRATGDEFLQHFIELGGLRPSDDVLDVGCGVGRMALPLTTFLDRHGSYTGLDIVPEAIRWSRRNITARFPAFNFELVDISNSRYNPDGTIDAASFRFPFPSASFDFVIATSLYTHLTPPATERYLAETSRVLRPGGRTLATFFLLDDDSLRAIEEGRAELGFVHRFGSARTLRPGDPEHAIALRAENVRHMFDAAGLDIQEPIYCGSWSGRTTARSYQDIIVACRSALDGS